MHRINKWATLSLLAISIAGWIKLLLFDQGGFYSSTTTMAFIGSNQARGWARPHAPSRAAIQGTQGRLRGEFVRGYRTLPTKKKARGSIPQM